MKCNKCQLYFGKCSLLALPGGIANPPVFDRIEDYKGEIKIVPNSRYKQVLKDVAKCISFISRCELLFDKGWHQYYIENCFLNKKENCKYFQPKIVEAIKPVEKSVEIKKPSKKTVDLEQKRKQDLKDLLSIKGDFDARN